MIDFRTLRFGCEVESTGATRETVARAIQSVVGGQVRHIGHPECYDPYEIADSRGRIWRVVADNSLSDAAPELRAEIVSPILSYSEIPELQQVIRSVRHAEAKSSRQAGVHICNEILSNLRKEIG